MWGRIRQTWQVLSAWGRPVDNQQAAQHLSPAEFALFMRMSRGDRQHHLRVLDWLHQAGYTDPALAVAALLHDVGKTRAPFTIFDRIIAVVVKRLWPGRFRQWQAGKPDSWTRPFVVSQHHPDWGAEMLAEAGSDPLAIALVQYHQTPLDDVPDDERLRRLLAALQAADDAS